MDTKVELLKEVAAKENVPFENAIPTGFKVFDDSLLGGLRDGDLVIVSGISGHGKTSFAQTLTYNFAQGQVPCLWFTYEVSPTHLQRKFDNMSDGAAATLPIYAPIKNTSGAVDWIARIIREARAQFGTKIIFIDHLDFLVPSDLKQHQNEALYLRNIVMELKKVALDIGVVIILMVHVKKQTGGDENEEPKMTDIAHSASIFQNADIVFMVYRIPTKQSVLLEDSGDLFTNQTRVKIVKNRVTGQSKFIMCVMEKDLLIQTTDDMESLV